ncbi:hypothetical protein [Mycetocola sp. JXN-3]|uniref:hypothetical protein n=1 Tax=Mycetocola sp. JXN-3 TaxID=2116510 RepID=UPI002103E443|nr:hypothetical protein [Mycetocola sp. JXN-3]
MTVPVASHLPARTAWGAIVIMMATSFILVTAEFLPPSLLPTMAASLGITEGQAGQAVTATAIIGFFTAPTIGIIFPGWIGATCWPCLRPPPRSPTSWWRSRPTSPCC